MKINSSNTNFNLRHLRAVHAIWAEGSFARAAQRLGVVPSALTETVRQIEEIAGGALFDRSTRPPLPTPLGLKFLEDTKSLQQQMDDALTGLRDHARGLLGVLRVGAAPSAISPILAPAITAFRLTHPKIVLQLHDDVAETLAQMVTDGSLDLAVAGRARSMPDLEQHEIGGDMVGLACHRDHPLAQVGRVTLSELEPESVIHLSAHTGTARLLADCPSVPAALKQGPLRTHSTIAQLCLVRSGVGVALLPRNAVELFNDPTIRFVEVADLDLRRRLNLLTPARRVASQAAQAFASLLVSPN